MCGWIPVSCWMYENCNKVLNLGVYIIPHARNSWKRTQNEQTHIRKPSRWPFWASVHTRRFLHVRACTYAHVRRRSRWIKTPSFDSLVISLSLIYLQLHCFKRRALIMSDRNEQKLYGKLELIQHLVQHWLISSPHADPHIPSGTTADSQSAHSPSPASKSPQSPQFFPSQKFFTYQPVPVLLSTNSTSTVYS